MIYEILAHRHSISGEDGDFQKTKILATPYICTTTEELEKYSEQKRKYYEQKYPDSTVEIDLTIRIKKE